MAVTSEDKTTLAKKLAKAGGNPKEIEKLTGVKMRGSDNASSEEIVAFQEGMKKGAKQAKKAAAEATQTPPEQAATPPEPKGKTIPKVTVGSMSATKSQRIIFGVMLFATAMTILGDVLSGRHSVTDAIPRRIAAGTIAGVMLMLLAIPLPRLASSLAGVIGVASLFVNPNGQKVLEAVSKIGGTKSEKGGASATPYKPL